MIAILVAAQVAKAEIDHIVSIDRDLPEIRSDRAPATLNMKGLQGKNGLVLIFFSEQCGVTFYYKQRIQQLQKDFEPLGFGFLGVRAGRREHPDQPIDIAEPNYLKMRFVDDAEGVLMTQFGIGQSVTFAVIDAKSTLRYVGGFDDNVTEKEVKHSYLRDALRAIAKGKAVPVKLAPAIGCAILPIKPTSLFSGATG